MSLKKIVIEKLHGYSTVDQYINNMYVDSPTQTY